MNETVQQPQMRKGFTMIELIFVIVIIGILAAVAIPRLAATRDDAKVAQCAADISIFMKDISAYYTSQGGFSTTMSDMTNVELYKTTEMTATGSAGKYYYVCDKKKTTQTAADAAVTFDFALATDAAGNKRVDMNATSADITQGSVDGDFGELLLKKNIAGKDTAITHHISGLRIKR